MRHRVGVFGIAVVLVAAGCDQSPQQPNAAPQFQFQDGSVVCDYKKGVNRAVRDFFNRPDERQVRDLVKTMEAASDPAVANDVGFDIIVRTQAAIGTPAQQGDLQDASNLVNQLLACMTFAAGEAPATAIDFTTKLGPTGAFGVVGGPNDPVSAPVVSADGNWGVEPVFGSDWPTVTGGERILIVGEPTSNGLGGENEVTFAFDFTDIPNIVFSEDVVVSSCLVETDQYRVQRETQILPDADPSFCPLPAAAQSIDSRFGPLALARTLVRLVRPSPLYADAALVGKGGKGGTASGFTRFVVVDAGAINLQFLDDPQNVTIDPNTGVADLTDLRVIAFGNNGTPLPEVDITINWSVNNGSNVVLGGTTTLRTDPTCSSVDACVPTGTVNFDDLTLNKPGGYRLVATATLFGFQAPGTATSTAFHVSQ